MFLCPLLLSLLARFELHNQGRKGLVCVARARPHRACTCTIPFCYTTPTLTTKKCWSKVVAGVHHLHQTSTGKCLARPLELYHASHDSTLTHVPTCSALTCLLSFCICLISPSRSATRCVCISSGHSVAVWPSAPQLLQDGGANIVGGLRQVRWPRPPHTRQRT